MKPVITAVLVLVGLIVFLSASLGFDTHLGYISFEDEPGHVQPIQGSGEPNQQGPILGASVVVPAAVSLSVAAKVAISITVIIVLAGLAVGAYFLWQNYQEDIIRVVDPETYNQKLEKKRLEKEQQELEAAKEREKQETDALALKEEQEKQAAADRLWIAKLVALVVSAVVGVAAAVVFHFVEGDVLRIMGSIILVLILFVGAVIAGALFQSWSLFFVTFFGFVFSYILNHSFFEIRRQGGYEHIWTQDGMKTGGHLILFFVVLLIALFV